MNEDAKKAKSATSPILKEMKRYLHFLVKNNIIIHYLCTLECHICTQRNFLYVTIYIVCHRNLFQVSMHTKIA